MGIDSQIAQQRLWCLGMSRNCLDATHRMFHLPGFWANHMTCVLQAVIRAAIQCFHPATWQNTMLSCLFHTMVDEVAYLGMDTGGVKGWVSTSVSCLLCLFIWCIPDQGWCKTHRYGRYWTLTICVPIEDPPQLTASDYQVYIIMK